MDVGLLGPCFKTGRSRPLSQRPGPPVKGGAFLGPGWRHGTPGKRRLARRRAHAPDVFLPPPEPTLARARASGPGTAAPDLAPEPGSDRERFPFDDFTYCLTLFSKCFSSFDHSTCSLSVSGLCLALEGVYLPLGAAFPNNPTRRRSFVWPPSPTPTGLSPSVASSSKEHGAGTTGRRLLCKLQLRRAPDFKFGLLPLRSPLLRQSLLVSFPPLIDMLKFSGYSRLIRGRTLVVNVCSSGVCPGRRLRVPRCQRSGALCKRSSWFPATSKAPSTRWGGFERRRLRFSGPSVTISGRRIDGRASPKTEQRLDVRGDARTGVPPGMPEGAMCVQRFNGSLDSAIHITYRVSLRSSSMPEPRDPSSKVLIFKFLVCICVSDVDKKGDADGRAFLAKGKPSQRQTRDDGVPFLSLTPGAGTGLVGKSSQGLGPLTEGRTRSEGEGCASPRSPARSGAGSSRRDASHSALSLAAVAGPLWGRVLPLVGTRPSPHVSPLPPRQLRLLRRVSGRSRRAS